MHHLAIDPVAVCAHLEHFIQESVGCTGLERVALGLSGGVDSALAAALAARALGKNKVLGIRMPWEGANPASLKDAEAVAESLGIRMETIDITPMVKAFAAALGDPDPLRLGNIMARARMTIIFDFCSAWKAIPLGTSNKTELLLGYGTWYGDLASAVNPLGDLYKQQVFTLARHLELPESVLQKAPSADLEAGQTDEDDLGWDYETIDRVLVRAVDMRLTEDRIVEEGFSRETVAGILSRVGTYHFKRSLPVIPKLSSRTIGLDWLYLRDAGR